MNRTPGWGTLTQDYKSYGAGDRPISPENRTMKYAVIQRYFDNGTIQADSIKVSDDTQPLFQERKSFDYYRDIFDDPIDAEEFRQECLKA